MVHVPPKPKDSHAFLCEYRWEFNPIDVPPLGCEGRRPYKGSPGCTGGQRLEHGGLYWIEPITYEKGMGKWFTRREDLEDE